MCRIRHELLPQLADAVHPEAVEAICRLGQLAAEAQAVIAPLAPSDSRREPESTGEPGLVTAQVAEATRAAAPHETQPQP